MHNGHHFYPNMDPPPPEYQVGSNYMNFPGASSFGADYNHGARHMKHFHGIEFQPSEVCPKNFIIFDQTDHRSQIMFNPAIAHKFSSPGLNMGAAYAPDNLAGGYRNHEVGAVSSSLKEDSDDIDALLSMEAEEEEQECDEDEVSTARTYGSYGGSSPESCSNYGNNSKKNRSSSSSSKTHRSSGGGTSSNCDNNTKRRKMKKMMRALRGIVPGGNEMNTATVLDEAVQYLKSLKVEVQKLGAGNLDD